MNLNTSLILLALIAVIFFLYFFLLQLPGPAPEKKKKRALPEEEFSLELTSMPEIEEEYRREEEKKEEVSHLPEMRVELPHSYAENLLKGIVRDPYCIYAYWDYSSETGAEIKDPLLLRVYRLSSKGHQQGNYQQHTLSSDSREYYLHNLAPDTDYRLELGVIEGDGFKVLLRSQKLHTPRDKPSDLIDSQWVTVSEIYAYTSSLQRTGKNNDTLGFIEEVEARRREHQASPGMHVWERE